MDGEHDPMEDIPPEEVARLEELGSQLSGELSPDEVRGFMDDYIAGLPPEAPVEEITAHMNEQFDAWVADGAPPFPPDGLTVEELMGHEGDDMGPEDDHHHEGEPMGEPMDGGHIPPPHPTGYVNDFIAPLFEGAPEGADGEPAWGLDYNEADPAHSTWTLPLSPDSVNMDSSAFTIPGDMAGTWEGGIPPEATENPDGSYTIQSWPIDNMVDNGDGTITLTVDIGPPAETPPV
jgi:hypothetical protein